MTRKLGLLFLLISFITPKVFSYNQLPPKTYAQQTLVRHIEHLHIGRVHEYKNLKFFTIESSHRIRTNGTRYVTLDEATDKGWLEIEEISYSGSVGTVRIKNNGTKNVFIMKGEIIVGAKQNRMATRSVLIPPCDTWFDVPVNCVERRRWSNTSAGFTSGKTLVPNSVRQKSTETASQGAVWREISKVQNECRVQSGTQNVVDVYKDKNIEQQINDYVRHFSYVPHEKEATIGIIVTTGDRIICVDTFANNKLLTKLWPKLIRSYAMDALHSKRSTVRKTDAFHFMEAMKRKWPSIYEELAVEGVRNAHLSLTNTKGKGSALVMLPPHYIDIAPEVVHMDFFPKSKSDQNPFLWDMGIPEPIFRRGPVLESITIERRRESRR